MHRRDAAPHHEGVVEGIHPYASDGISDGGSENGKERELLRAVIEDLNFFPFLCQHVLRLL